MTNTIRRAEIIIIHGSAANPKNQNFELKKFAPSAPKCAYLTSSTEQLPSLPASTNMTTEITVLHPEDHFETLIEGLVKSGYGISDHFFSTHIIEGLRDHLLAFKEAELMHPARIGRKFDLQQNAEVRGDVIKWLERESADPVERVFFEQIRAFIAYLNRTCYAGINAFEFHYAHYGPGSFYKRHLDQFKTDRGRKFSLVCYLNKDWKPEDGGQLLLYLEGQRQVKVEPVGGRVIFFRSDEMEHEVLPAPDRSRLSIAGWLKSV